MRTLAEIDLTEWVAAVDEEDAAGLKRGLDGGAGENAGFGVATVQRTDPDGDGQIEAFFALGESKCLGGRLPKGEHAVGDLVGGTSLGLIDSGGGAVDGEDEAPALQPERNLPRHGAGTATDLEHAHTRPQWQGVHDLTKPSGKCRGHYSAGARKFWLSQPEVPSGVVT